MGPVSRALPACCCALRERGCGPRVGTDGQRFCPRARVARGVGTSRLARCYLRRGNLRRARDLLSGPQRLIADYGLRGDECTEYHNTLAEIVIVAAEQAIAAEKRDAFETAKRACRSALKQARIG